MKYLAIACLLLSGCSTMSEYKRGCVDGVTNIADQVKGPYLVDNQMVSYYCSMIESRNKDKPTHEKNVVGK